MDRLQWLKERQKGIGGSDAAAVLGVSRWKSPFTVYMEKTEEITEDAKALEAAYWGNNMKQILAKEFVKETGKKVRRDNRQLHNKEYPFMIANIDRRIIGENSILQLRTSNAFNVKEWEGEEIPAGSIIQCQHYLAVTEADLCYVAVLIGGQKFKVTKIARDEELIRMIIDAEKDFWTMHVEKKIPPEIDGSSSAAAYLKIKFPKSELCEVGLKAENRDKITRYLSLKDNIKLLDREAKTLENSIKLELGSAERGTIENYMVNWKAVVSNRIDSSMLKDKYPEVYTLVLRETVSRRFEIREC